jgi:hypothetical protein
VFSLAHTGQLALLRYFLNGIAFTAQPETPFCAGRRRWLGGKLKPAGLG